MLRSLLFWRRRVPNSERSHRRHRLRIIKFLVVMVPLLFCYQTIIEDGGTALTRLSSRDGDDTYAKVKSAGAESIEGEYEALHDPVDKESSGGSVDINIAESSGDDGKKSETSLVEFKQNHWEIQLSGNRNLTCKIHTYPKYSSGAAPVNITKEYTSDSQKEQYVIHIHGLHHTGTGYLRQTLHDALNREFSTDDDSSPVASIHDSMRPYQHLLEQARKERNKEKFLALYKEHKATENEGQHLQTVYPAFASRIQLARNPNSRLYVASLLGYLASLCTITNEDGDSPSHQNNRRIGIVLLEQWMRYWDRSATFLLQKTPTVDVLFLERVKVLPTLHVIVVRHPMTSNSWKFPRMSLIWPNVWAQVFETLRQGEIEWYAVVTYEALVSNHAVVVEELMEVVRSGMYHNKKGGGKSKTAAASNAQRHLTGKDDSQLPQLKPRRRLHLREGGESNETYLIPKENSVTLWEKCLSIDKCGKTLEQLTRDVFPFFGFVNVHQQNGVPLRASPGTVTVSKEFGHVLFSSEGDALNKLRQYQGNHQIDYKPPLELISKMKEFSIK